MTGAVRASPIIACLLQHHIDKIQKSLLSFLILLVCYDTIDISLPIKIHD
jgi:hypothetical protein